MAERPVSLSQRPNEAPTGRRAEAGPRVDPLSDVLQTVRLTGAVFFMLVVVLTMFSTLSFDPRLTWDPLDTRHE